jgi:L-alanine-DL-glutamate epimerase-like enolase superfamily enzyme
MTDVKQTSEQLRAIVAESERLARETQLLLDVNRRLSDADARLARALKEIGSPPKRHKRAA